jgi:hypothetical protein
MRLFKAADEELDDEESNVENRLREFTLEDPDEFVDLESEEETALTGDKRKQYGGVYTWCTRPANTKFSGMARVQKDRGNGPDAHYLLLGSRGSTCGGRLCNATSLLEVVTLLCGTLPPTQMVRPHSPPLHRRMYKLFQAQILGESDGRKYQRRTRMLPIRHCSD